MTFSNYESIRDQLAPETCTKLDALSEQYGLLEVKQITSQQFCLRIHALVKEEITPFASIGRSIDQAADRLARLTKTIVPSLE